LLRQTLAKPPVCRRAGGALLLLKGLSFKEIAAVRNTLEKTVRQQASGIYKKAGVSSRHAFAVWFIEDFL
jgi:DNA-binding NarL/FixJ family response regulator